MPPRRGLLTRAVIVVVLALPVLVADAAGAGPSCVDAEIRVRRPDAAWKGATLDGGAAVELSGVEPGAARRFEIRAQNVADDGKSGAVLIDADRRPSSPDAFVVEYSRDGKDITDQIEDGKQFAGIRHEGSTPIVELVVKARANVGAPQAIEIPLAAERTGDGSVCDLDLTRVSVATD